MSLADPTFSDLRFLLVVVVVVVVILVVLEAGAPPVAGFGLVRFSLFVVKVVFSCDTNPS